MPRSSDSTGPSPSAPTSSASASTAPPASGFVPSSASELTPPSNPSWRYGVYLFPVAPLLLLLTYATLGLFVYAVEAESVGVGIGAFVVTVLAGWASYLLVVVVAVALVADALALRDHPSWSPNPWLAGGLALVYLTGPFLAIPYLLSVPGIAYYVYRRRQYVGRDGGDGNGESVASADSERSRPEH